MAFHRKNHKHKCDRKKDRKKKRYNPNRIQVRIPITGLLDDFGLVSRARCAR